MGEGVSGYITYALLTLGPVVQDAAPMVLIANGQVADALVSNLLCAVVQAIPVRLGGGQRFGGGDPGGVGRGRSLPLR